MTTIPKEPTCIPEKIEARVYWVEEEDEAIKASMKDCGQEVSYLQDDVKQLIEELTRRRQRIEELIEQNVRLFRRIELLEKNFKPS